MLSFTFFHSWFYNFLSKKPFPRVNTKDAPNLLHRCKQSNCGFHVCPVVAPSSIFASGNEGADFLGFSRHTAKSDTKCDRAFCYVCLSLHLGIYLISLFLLITQTFCKGNEEQLGYLER